VTEIRPLTDAAVSLIRTEATQQEVEIEAKVNPGLPVSWLSRFRSSRSC